MNRILFFALFVSVMPAAAQDDFTALATRYANVVIPILERTCLGCHDTETQKGELDLERFVALTEVRKDTKVWQQVVEQIEIGEMPPKDKKQLSDGEKEELLGWVKSYLRAEAMANAGDPGPVVLRRLSNAEFNYTIRDLTRIESLNPTEEFPVDSAAGEGFTNTGDALAMTPALFEKYLDAGKEIAEHAVLLPDGFRFSDQVSRRDRSAAIVERIRSFYQEVLDVAAIDYGYRDQVGAVAPADEREGRLDLAPYFAALLGNADSDRRLNEKYLAQLKKVLSSPNDTGSLLIRELRRQWQSAEEIDAEALGHWVRAWQDRLWKFNAVGHLAGYAWPWQEAVNPVVSRRDVQMKLEPKESEAAIGLHLNVATAGDGSVGDVIRWENPRIVRPGRAPLLLRDVRAVASRFEKFRVGTLTDVESLLGAAFLARRQTGKVDMDALAKSHGVDAHGLQLFLGYLGVGGDTQLEIENYLTEKRESIGGHAVISGWGRPGIGDLSLISNRSDETWHIPGEVPPHSIVVHPHPQHWVAAGWKSPLHGEVRIEAQVQGRHGCGNGTRWIVEHRRGAQQRVLQDGVVGALARAEIAPVERLEIEEGDLISLMIDARDGNHACDLTEIDLKISYVGKEGRRWSLREDCADTILAGNPHGDTAGGLDVWHFYSGQTDQQPKEWTAFPANSLIAEWVETDDATVATSLAKRLKSLLQDDVSPTVSRPNRELIDQLRRPDGPLFVRTDLNALPEVETVDERYGLDPSLFTEEGHLVVAGPISTAFQLPANLVAGGDFVATGVLTEEGSVQLSLTTSEPAGLDGIQPDVPIMVPAGSEAERRVLQAFADFREIFPAALCYARVVPIDEVVTLILYHREDEPLYRLMLDDDQRKHIDRLWDELYYVSHDAYRLEIALEQILEFSTQDADPSKFDPMLVPVANKASELTKRLRETEPMHLDQLIAFAAKAYRRPVSMAESHGLRALYHSLRHDELSHAEAFRLTLARVFASPPFLYRAETAPHGVKQGPISNWEQATRLSYFLWASAPDEMLAAAARNGELADSQQLIVQAKRMLKDARAGRLAVEFACQWLHVRDFDTFDEKNERLYPEFAGLRGAMYEETQRFFADLFQNNGSILNILDADHSFLNRTLSQFYNVPVTESSDSDWQRVGGLKDRRRGGILGMATTLARQSGASRTSPILRGNWVSETLLGEKLPKPPDNVPQLPETVPEGLSERELIERHASDPACAKCHRRIDPYGFALEDFDAIGRYRDGVKRDTKTVLVDGTEVNGLDGLRSYLLEDRRETFVRHFCRKLLGYALGRAVRLSDEPLLDEMWVRLQAAGYRFHTAVECIVTSRQFREIRGQNPLPN